MNEGLKVTINLNALLKLFIEGYMCRLTSSEFKIFMLIYQLTIGNGVQMASITLKKITEGTGLTKNTVIKSIRTLQEQEFLCQLTGCYPYKYMLNYSTIYTGYGSKYDLNEIVIESLSISNSPITTGFPKEWELID